MHNIRTFTFLTSAAGLVDQHKLGNGFSVGIWPPSSEALTTLCHADKYSDPTKAGKRDMQAVVLSTDFDAFARPSASLKLPARLFPIRELDLSPFQVDARHAHNTQLKL